MDRERFDVYLVKNEYFTSREKARAAIMAGAVYIDGKKELKPAFQVSPEMKIEVRENVHPYVSRGGLKLHKAVEVFNLNLKDRICMDIGASTGGFTDCMLKNGASLVYSVDVGTNQLAEELRHNEKVVSLENTDVRSLKAEDLSSKLSFCSIDVSFISLKKVLPYVKNLFKDTYEIVCLVKPQFEAGRGRVGRNGVVKDKKVHLEVLMDICVFCISEGFNIKGIDFSPIKGPEGNIEYLIYLSSEPSSVSREQCSFIAKNTVEEAFKLK